VPSCSTTKKRSLVWTYFRESVIDKEAICNRCEEEKVSTSGNTTNMVKVSDALFVQMTRQMTIFRVLIIVTHTVLIGLYCRLCCCACMTVVTHPKVESGVS